MTETAMLTLAGMLVAALFGVLTAIVGWIGSRVVEKLDALVTMLHALSNELHDKINTVSGELHGRINKLDIRTTAIESKCGVHHDIHMHRRGEDV
jgi:hypothetical protein